jgi:hypothetical protein
VKQDKIEPRFVEFIPETIEDGFLYISETHGTAIHKCCCGCGEEVVTPLGSARWRLVKRRGKVSLIPSIGNWNYACQAHYWIRRNKVEWAPTFSRDEILLVQARDEADQAAATAAQNVIPAGAKRWMHRIGRALMRLLAR